jgi:hypothetical protein
VGLQAVHRDGLLLLAHLDDEGLGPPWRPPGMGWHIGPLEVSVGRQRARKRVLPELCEPAVC